MIESHNDSEIYVMPIMIPKTVYCLLMEISKKKNTTIGAMITRSVRKIVSDEIGESALIEIEREL